CRQRFLSARKPRVPSSRPWIPRTKLPSLPWTLRRTATTPRGPGIDQQAPAERSTAPAPTPDPDHNPKQARPSTQPPLTPLTNTQSSSQPQAKPPLPLNLPPPP
ncbi:conserved hypothetical protein, partial [Ixodes scapularis]